MRTPTFPGAPSEARLYPCASASPAPKLSAGRESAQSTVKASRRLEFKVIFTRLPFGCQDYELMHAASVHGPVLEAQIMGGGTKVFGVVAYEDEADVTRALHDGLRFGLSVRPGLAVTVYPCVRFTDACVQKLRSEQVAAQPASASAHAAPQNLVDSVQIREDPLDPRLRLFAPTVPYVKIETTQLNTHRPGASLPVSLQWLGGKEVIDAVKACRAEMEEQSRVMPESAVSSTRKALNERWRMAMEPFKKLKTEKDELKRQLEELNQVVVLLSPAVLLAA